MAETKAEATARCALNAQLKALNVKPVPKPPAGPWRDKGADGIRLQDKPHVIAKLLAEGRGGNGDGTSRVSLNVTVPGGAGPDGSIATWRRVASQLAASTMGRASSGDVSGTRRSAEDVDGGDDSDRGVDDVGGVFFASTQRPRAPAPHAPANPCRARLRSSSYSPS